MSNYAVTWVEEHSPYRGGKYTLHLVLADTAGDPDFELWGRQQYFADKARIDRARCCVYLKEMVAEGALLVLEDHSKHRKPNRYKMLLPDDAAKVFDCKSGAYATKMPTFEERAEAASTCALTAPVETCAPEPHVQSDKDPACALSQHEHVRSAQPDMCAQATQNPSRNPSSNPRKNARGDFDLSAPESVVAASGDAPSGPSDAVASVPGPERESAETETRTLFESEGSPADAGAAPPDSAGPPHAHAPGLAVVRRRLAQAVAAHSGKAVKTDAWDRDLDLLLRRGPTQWKVPEPIPVETVLAVIDWVFGPGAVLEPNGFCWANQVQSGAALRRHWFKIYPVATRRGLAPVRGRREDPRVQAEREMAELRAEYERGDFTPESVFPTQVRKAREAAEARERARRSA